MTSLASAAPSRTAIDELIAIQTVGPRRGTAVGCLGGIGEAHGAVDYGVVVVLAGTQVAGSVGSVGGRCGFVGLIATNLGVDLDDFAVGLGRN